MRIATKLGLAAFFESEAATTERYVRDCGPGMHPDMKARYVRRMHNERVAAFALRRMTADQEVEMLEFQAGGEDGSGVESYDNPVKIVRPEFDSAVLYGPAGSGKTTLAREIAAKLGLWNIRDNEDRRTDFTGIAPGTLAISQRLPVKTRKGTRVLEINDAKAYLLFRTTSVKESVDAEIDRHWMQRGMGKG